MEFAALPWDSSVNRFAAVPKTGSAPHHLVTVVSIKKALMRPIQNPAGGWARVPGRKLDWPAPVPNFPKLSQRVGTPSMAGIK